MGKVNPLFHVSVFLCVLSVPGLAAAQTGSFDVPLRKEVVDLGPSRYYPNGAGRIKLTCYFYPGFLIKEVDAGEKGAEQLALAPAEAGVRPSCSQSAASGEKAVEDQWAAYFRGAKGNLVFFYAADGINRGMPFVIYNSQTGTKVFRDSTYDSKWLHTRVEASPFNVPQFKVCQDGRVFLRYLRVVATDCDLYRERASCWERVRKKFEIKSAELPVCSGYTNIRTRWVSAIAYPVQVSLLAERPSIETVAGPVRCWPVD